MNEAEEWDRTNVWLQSRGADVPLFRNPTQSDSPTIGPGRNRWFEAHHQSTLAIHVRVPETFDIRIYHAIECSLSFDGRLVFTWQVSMADFKKTPSYCISRIMYPLAATTREKREIVITKYFRGPHHRDPHSVDPVYHRSRPIPIELDTQLGTLCLELRRIAVPPHLCRGPFVSSDMNMEKFWAQNEEMPPHKKTHRVHLQPVKEIVAARAKCLPKTFSEPKAVFRFFYRNHAQLSQQAGLELVDQTFSKGKTRSKRKDDDRKSASKKGSTMETEDQMPIPPKAKHKMTKSTKDTKLAIRNKSDAGVDTQPQLETSPDQVADNDGALAKCDFPGQQTHSKIQQRPRRETVVLSSDSDVPRAGPSTSKPKAGSTPISTITETSMRNSNRRRLVIITEDLEELARQRRELELEEMLRLANLARSGVPAAQDKTRNERARLTYELARVDIDLEEIRLMREQVELTSEPGPVKVEDDELAIAEAEAELASVKKARAEHRLKRKRGALEEELSGLREEESPPQAQGKRIKMEPR